MIIDTHQHFWNVGRPGGKGPEEYKILTAPEGVTGTILRLEDTAFALELAAREPLIVGVCGDVKSGPQFGAELEQYAANPLFRGIRLLGRALERVDQGLLSEMQALAASDLELDLLRVCPGFFGGPRAMQALYTGTAQSLAGMFAIAERVPQLRIVVQHIGGMPIDGQAPGKEWERVLRRMAEYPQITVKVSGLMERATTRAEGERATELLAFYRPALDALWDIFGEDRLMYGSNWPVCEHAGDFVANGIRIVRRYFAEKGVQASEKFFWKNSQKIYQWKARLASQR